MKLIPALSLTVLAAAATAQTAPAAAPAAKQSISYSRVILSTVSQSGGGLDGVSVFAQSKLSGGLYLSAKVTNFDNTIAGDNTEAVANLGYAYTLGSFAGVTTDVNVEIGHDTFGLGLRSLLAPGLELGLAYANTDEQAQDVYTVALNYSLGQFVKGLTVNLSYSDQRGDVETTSLGVGYSF